MNWKTIAQALVAELQPLEQAVQVEALNEVRRMLHDAGPFKDEPVDLVEWIPAAQVEANDYNPNAVSSPEMKLLETSILADGYTQPIVTHDEGSGRVVVDGFHRNRVGKESEAVRKRINGYLPCVKIRAEQTAKEKRMASTVRHNRARGKHGVAPMTDIVAYLVKKGWDDAKVSKELGMDLDEVLRFRQIGGLAALYKDQEFSKAWDIEDVE
jgi:ParB-like chromosome segregation protein Spo0J